MSPPAASPKRSLRCAASYRGHHGWQWSLGRKARACRVRRAIAWASSPSKQTVEGCARRGVEVLTLFAFSSENWQRPREEVSMLMGRFLEALDNEVDDLHKNGIRLRFIGRLEQLSTALRDRMQAAQALTAGNTRMTLVIAIAYGGRWDIAAAAQELARRCVAGEQRVEDIDEAAIGTAHCAGRICPIRTCSSAPAASSASAISCCGIWLTPNCISATRSGRISATTNLRRRSIISPVGSAASD